MVLPNQVDRIWPIIEIDIARYLKTRSAGYGLADVKREMETGESLCYVIVKDDQLCGVCVFHVERRPQGKVVFISGVAGRAMHEWMELGLTAIKQYADKNSIGTIEAQTRPGLRKTLLDVGWRHAADIMELRPWAESRAKIKQ